MRGSRWVRNALLLLLVVAAASDSSPAKRDPESTEIWRETSVKAVEDAGLTIAPAESQQISAVGTSDLQASETGYDKGYGKVSTHKGHKGYKGGYHDDEGYKGKKGYTADKGYKKNHYGDYGKDHKAGYHDKGGKYYKGHDDKHKYYGDEHKGKKGKKGHHYGSKGHHNKGHKDKGFKNVYHKEEYHHHKKYYDDFDNQKYHNKYDDFDSYFDGHKGKDYKGGHYKRDITQKNDRTHTQNEPQNEESLIMLRVNTALEKQNETQTITTFDVDTKTMRYFGRVLLDTSRYRTRYEDRDDYNDQCQPHDLKLIKKYLKNCNRFMRKYSSRKDRTPPCVNEDIAKIIKYLNICERSFTSRASHRKRKQYNELMDLGNKLDMMTYPEVVTGENHYVTEDVCQADDLRQMELYLKDCASGRIDEEDSGRPACDLPNYEKSLDYLTACESTFLSKASRDDRNEYNHLISVALTLIKKEVAHTERVKHEESDDSQTSCTVEDLRESQNYIEECESLLLTESYQREYGSQMCRPKYMKKVHKFLLSCKHLLRNAPSKEQQKYSQLLDTSARLSGKPGKKKTGKKTQIQVEDPIDEHPDCRLQDLRSVPKYLRGCYKSKKCESETLLEVHEFLVMCEESFLEYASHRDEKKYKDLVLMSDMLSTNEILQKEKRDHEDKEHMESICKIQILRKVPKYLKGCFESGNCNSKQLLKVIKFLSLCEEFFSIAFSPKDRGKYKELKDMAEELHNHAEEKNKSKTQEKKEHKGPHCTLSDLRKIPDYLQGCDKTHNCENKQLLKIHQFLVYCEIPFTRSASQRDKRKFKKIILLSEKLSENRQSTEHLCEVSQLRQLPKYLLKCSKFQNCNPKQLFKVQKYLRLCESAFFRRASKRDKTKYKELSTLAVTLARNRNRRVPRRGVERKRKEIHSQCQIKDLRKIPSYLKNCASTYNCKHKQMIKVTKFLVSCKDEFEERASRKDKAIYQKLYMKAKTLSKYPKKRGSHIQEEKDRESYCQIKDLRKIPIYLKRCTKTRQCKLRQLIKVRRFLSTCQNHFAKNASRRDEIIYKRLSSSADTLSTHLLGKGGHKRQIDKKLSFCKIRDLRKIPSYLKNFSKSHICDRRQLLKVNRFLTSCKTVFFRKASRRDKKMYQRFSSRAEALSKQSSQKRSQRSKRDAKLSHCKLKDLQKVPSYVKNCSKSHICDRRQLLKVNRFLTSCKTVFLRKASRRDMKMYQRLSSSTEALSKQISKNRSQTRKRDAKLSHCKLKDLQKVPSYVKNCSKSYICDRRQLLKVNRFLTSCKTVFLRKASRRDKKMYQRLSSSTEALSKRSTKKRSQPSKRDAKLSHCKLKDLQKVPSYVKNCSKSYGCDRRQLLKVNRFLTSCKTVFLRQASRGDKKMYQRLSSSTETLSKHTPITISHKRKREARVSYCKLRDLRKLPNYLKTSHESHKFDSRKLIKVKNVLASCKSSFTRKASRKDKRIYKRLFVMTEALIKRRLRKKSSKDKNITKERHATRSPCQIRDLRKVPSYLKSCSKTHDCKYRQMVKVKRFLTSCQTHFMRRASRKDSRVYKGLIRLSKRLVSKDQDKKRGRRRRITPEKQGICQVKNLKLVQKHLGNCGQKARQLKGSPRGICKSKPITKMQKYLLSCQKMFLRRSTHSDRAKYKSLLILLEKLKKPRITKDRKRDVRRRGIKRSICHVRDLRKIPKYLKDCSTGVIIRGKKIACGKTILGKIRTFLSSCKSAFLKKSSRKDRVNYRRLEYQANAIQSRRAKGKDIRRVKKPSAKRVARCKVQDLRKVKSYLKDCSNVIKKGARTRRHKKYNTRILSRVQHYLKSCQSSFLKKASRGDKKQYKYLSVLAAKLSKQISRGRDKTPPKKTERYSCRKQDIRELEKHYKFCKAKVSMDTGRKSQLRRRRVGSRAQKRHRQKKLKQIRSRRQYRKYNSHSRKRSRRMGSIEHGRRRGRRWRARLKYRKGGKHHDKHAKKGHHEKGKYHDDHKGHKGHYAHKGHYGHKSAYGDKGGYKGGFGHDDHHGGYGHQDHGGYGHGYSRRYLDPYLPKLCFSERFCVPFTPPYMYPFPFLVL